ncbi:MAG: hypothetical protein A2X82_15535 [Geobacteraceae bacterium GWC2_55_20]|nr:MAG: hypothetical protein A2X82_15535 [Geobacteraceae bacterium GWC2_55_20]OGU22349.1 MAG: hypothetical protein A2X85_13595 [Geobacteraceae bacterium GWF2_54_21]HCE68192.1 hypothetical protein [Geobacter sp.]
MQRDFEIIHTYTRAEAIADGVLIDLTTNYPNEAKLFKFPVACTDAVWQIIDQAATNKQHHQTHAGIIWDILYMSIHGITRRFSDAEHLFTVIITGASRQQNYTLKAICGPSDDLSPCITILTEFED